MNESAYFKVATSPTDVYRMFTTFGTLPRGREARNYRASLREKILINGIPRVLQIADLLTKWIASKHLEL